MRPLFGFFGLFPQRAKWSGDARFDALPTTISRQAASDHIGIALLQGKLWAFLGQY